MKELREDMNKSVFSALIIICGIITAGLGMSALTGWIARLPMLTTFWSGKIPMAPSTALLFVLYGTGIILFARLTLSRAAYRIGLFVGVLGVLAGGFFFVISLMGTHSAIEHLGISITGMVNGVPVGHMSPLTAFCFILAGLAFLSLLLSTDRDYYSPVAFGFAFLIVLTSSSLLFAYFLGAPFFYGGGVIPPSLPAALAFLILGTGLLFSSLQKEFSDGKSPDASIMRAAYVLVTIFVFSASGILTAGYLYFRHHEKQYSISVEKELSAVKDLKVAELAQWRKERLEDAAILFRNNAFSELVRRYFNKPEDPGVRGQLLEWMSKFHGTSDINQVRLLDLQGVSRLSIPSGLQPASPGELKDFFEIIQSGQPSITDFYRSDRDHRIYLAVQTPIIDSQHDGQPLGILSLRINPDEYLYPLIQSWPTPSRTGETLLVRREGKEVIFLNELRHRKDTAFSLRFPLSKKDLPAAMAVLGTTGVIEGVDYRGVPVIASIGPISGSPWFIVSKMDEEEIYSPIRESLWAVVIVVGLLLLGSGLSVGMVWRQQRIYYYKELYQSEFQLSKEREKVAEQTMLHESRLKSIVNILQYQTASLQDFLDYALEEAIKLTNSKIGYIYHYDEDKKEFILNSWSNDVMKECTVLEKQTVYHLDKTGIWGEAVRQRKPVILNDFQSANPLRKGYPEGHVKLNKYMTIPVFSNNKIVAVIGVANKGSDYDETDVLQLTLLMDAIWKVVGKKEAEDNLQRYMEELKRSNEELKQFAYIASHDLQEPLRMIASYLQLIERRYKGKLDKDADEFIAFAVEGASRLQEMIIGLLAYSRVETKGKPSEEINSADVLGNAVANLKFVIDDNGALITAGTLPVIRADAGQLLQVFQNLISNAIKFRGSDAPLIHISAKPILDFGDRILDLTDSENSEVQNLNSKIPNAYMFSVKDNGVGIEPEYKEKVFDMFRRLHGREYPGVGIGLSLCRRIIERHKGRIWLESEAGKGTTFYFTIPIK